MKRTETSEQIREQLRDMYETVESTVCSFVADYVDDLGSLDEGLSTAYQCFRMYSGYKREETGIRTEHGVANAISIHNKHAEEALEGSPIVPDVPLFADGAKRGLRRNDYFFYLNVLDDGDVVARMPWVLNSPEVTRLLRQYEKAPEKKSTSRAGAWVDPHNVAFWDEDYIDSYAEMCLMEQASRLGIDY